MNSSLSEPEPHNQIFSAATLEGEPPPRVWTVPGYIPQGVVTGLFGQGGIGKTLLGQQLGTSISSGMPWLGMEVNQHPVIGYFCEDDKNELWRRQKDINEDLKLERENVADFYMQSRAGMDNILMKFSSGIGTKTDFFKQIESDIVALQAKTIILDNAAQMFGGDENQRREVTQFVNALHGLINGGDLTILLLGHPPKQGVGGVQHEYSGSTAWDACFRSRLFFGAPDKNDDDEEDDYRVLTKKKANYSKPGDFIKVKWEKGVFIPTKDNISFVDRLEISVKLKQAKNEFLKMLDVLQARNQEVSHSPASQNYAPKLMVGLAQAKAVNLSFKMLASAMNSLIDEHEIMPNEVVATRNGRKIYGLKRKVTK